MTKRVLVISRSYDETEVGFERLRSAGLEVVIPPDGPGLSRDALIRAISDVDGTIVGTQRFDAEMLDPNGRLRAIVKAGAGLDNIDLDAAKIAKIEVAAVPGANARAVAEFSVALMLAVGRGISTVDAQVRQGAWDKFRGVDLPGATVGVVGLGNVGRRVCQFLRGFDVHLLGFDVTRDEAFIAESGIEMVELDELVQRSDFVSLHAPLTDSSFHMIDQRRLGLMKPSAVLVNAARGELVDTDALYEALSNNKIFGAGLDVFESEPFKDERFFVLDNVVLSSHNAAFSNDGIGSVVAATADIMVDLLSGD